MKGSVVSSEFPDGCNEYGDSDGDGDGDSYVPGDSDGDGKVIDSNANVTGSGVDAARDVDDVFDAV